MAFETVVDMGLSESQRSARSEAFVGRAIEEVYPSREELAIELAGDRRLTAYMGIDPTAPELHVGHQSQLLKLREIQQLGHKVILLIGDFTARIGDPTDKSAARVKLTEDEVTKNAEGYREQASKILDFNHPTNPVELRYNSEWLGAMDFADVLELASEFTVQQMLQRDMFERRIAEGKPVGVHEFIYPLMQGWDSVCMDVDIEVGGSDQIFNMLTGSTLVRRHLEKQKYVVAGKLLVDPSGKKIGKTEGNMVTLNADPRINYEKIMRWGDAIVPHALELCTSVPMGEVQSISSDLTRGSVSGIEAKRYLADKMIEEIDGISAARDAANYYDSIRSVNPHEIIDKEMLSPVNLEGETDIVSILVQAGLANSKSAARRLIAGGAVRLNEITVTESNYVVEPSQSGTVLQVGKRISENFRRINFEA